MKRLKEINKKKILLEDLQKLYKIETYTLLYEKVKELLEQGAIEPIKASGLNGKSPALYQGYRMRGEIADVAHYQEELKYHMHVKLDMSYYLNHIEQYKRDREQILLLNNYLKCYEDGQEKISLNERSFEIWGREKFLKQDGGVVLLRRLGLSIEDLNVYETIVPVAYYVQNKKISQNVLIIENKDTFYSIRQHLMQGNDSLLGIEIGTLIYGGGKQIVKAFEPFIEMGEVYLRDKSNKIIYFGDLDYEGIGIYESLVERIAGQYEISIFKEAYRSMLKKQEKMICSLPQAKEQHKVAGEQFFGQFEIDEIDCMKAILEDGLYIPQEILSRLDF